MVGLLNIKVSEYHYHEEKGFDGPIEALKDFNMSRNMRQNTPIE
jgi:hypothetical protein